MKILSNKKYNELLLKPLQGCFAQVDDDMLLRENGLLYAENKRLHSIINEFMEELKWQRKISLSLNEAFAVSRIDTLINKLQELKGSDKE